VCGVRKAGAGYIEIQGLECGGLGSLLGDSWTILVVYWR